MTANSIRTLTAIVLSLLLFTTTVSLAKVISSNCELVHPKQQKIQTVQKDAPRTSDPLLATDKIWTIDALLPITGDAGNGKKAW